MWLSPGTPTYQIIWSPVPVWPVLVSTSVITVRLSSTNCLDITDTDLGFYNLTTAFLLQFTSRHIIINICSSVLLKCIFMNSSVVLRSFGAQSDFQHGSAGSGMFRMKSLTNRNMFSGSWIVLVLLVALWFTPPTHMYLNGSQIGDLVKWAQVGAVGGILLPAIKGWYKMIYCGTRDWQYLN